MSEPITATCSCGSVRVAFRSPLMRAHCHCTICQRVNDAPWGEPVLVWRHRVQAVRGADRLRWQRTRWLPIHVNRGACTECGDLMLEHVAFSPLSIVLAGTVDTPERLPPLAGHMFYDRRVADVDDALPKRHGWVASQLGFTVWTLRALTRTPPRRREGQ